MKRFANMLCGFMLTIAFSPLAFADPVPSDQAPPPVPAPAPAPVPAPVPPDGSCKPLYTLDLTGPTAVRNGETPTFQILVRHLNKCEITSLNVVYYFPNIAPLDTSDFSVLPLFFTLDLDPTTFIWPVFTPPPQDFTTITHRPTIDFTTAVNMVARACVFSVNGPAICKDWRFAVNPPVPLANESDEAN